MGEKPETKGMAGRPGKSRRTLPFAALCLAAALILLAAGCGGKPAPGDKVGDGVAEKRLTVVASFYPLYDFAAKIGGDDADVVNLVPAGVDSHDWSPKLQDMRQISEADLFLYLGAGYEGWVDDFLGALAPGEGPLVVEASRGADLIRLSGDGKAHSATDGDGRGHDDGDGHGHEDGDHDDGDHDDGDHDDGEHDGGEDGHGHNHDHDHLARDTDPHVWLSPKQALVLADNIKKAFIGADPENRTDYEARHERLKAQLLDLDARMTKVAAEAKRKTFIVSHESFGYLARDYGLTQIGVMGLAPDAEPTLGKLEEIRDEARRLGIRYILFEELVSPKVAETLAGSLGIDTLVLNPLEGLTEEQLSAGEDYFTVMERNLTTLAVALE